MANRHAPRGYQTVTPYLTVQSAEEMIDFLKSVFGGEELSRHMNPDGAIKHAEVRIGDTILELSTGNERYAPRQNTLHIFVADTDDCYRRALEAGATSLYEAADNPYGERSAGVVDPFGNHWYIATFLRGEGQGYSDGMGG